MAHAVLEEEPQAHMGLPLSNGKLAMWMFLVTEVMFFTALVGVYVLLRQSAPSTGPNAWPSPHQVHVDERLGAINTFVLICSSLTVVLAHYVLGKGKVGQAAMYIAVSLALGCVFLGIKAVEYRSKWQHDILPSHVGEELSNPPTGQAYAEKIKEQLKAIEKAAEKNPQWLPSEIVEECKALQKDMQESPDRTTYNPGLSPEKVGERVMHILHKGEEDHHEVPLTPVIPHGNMWASCYFAMTGFHALHVLGGLVIFTIILLMAALGRLGTQHCAFLEYTGLYWHFVDIVWIFLFPLIYLI